VADARPAATERPAPVVRPEIENRTIEPGTAAAVARPLGPVAWLAGKAWFRKTAILACLVLAWEAYARHLGNPLLVPTFGETMAALWEAAADGVLGRRVATSLRVLLTGYAIGVLAAAVLTSLAVSSRIGTDLLSTLTSMFNPLPAIALLPVAMLWFGLGQASLVFVIVHSVLWAVALNTHTGFLAVAETQRMAGRNYGLRGLPFVLRILVPAAFPSILSGLKIGWAFAWRTQIAAELVFGATSASGGLGWFIFEARNQLDTAAVFAGLTAVIIIGLVVENLIFRWIERRTVRRWGMQR
jgi:NitT/TauT family transport system permease protein